MTTLYHLSIFCYSYFLTIPKHIDGQTLNAVTFQSIIGTLGMPTWANGSTLALILALEAGLLLIAANTDFLGGPAIMANMAADSWGHASFFTSLRVWSHRTASS